MKRRKKDNSSFDAFWGYLLFITALGIILSFGRLFIDFASGIKCLFVCCIAMFFLVKRTE